MLIKRETGWECLEEMTREERVAEANRVWRVAERVWDEEFGCPNLGPFPKISYPAIRVQVYSRHRDVMARLRRAWAGILVLLGVATENEAKLATEGWKNALTREQELSLRNRAGAAIRTEGRA